MEDSKVLGFRSILRFRNGVFYALRARDSSYFDFIPTFGLNWDCFEADFGMVFMPCFVALIRMVLVPSFVVLLRTVLGHVFFSKFGVQ